MSGMFSYGGRGMSSENVEKFPVRRPDTVQVWSTGLRCHHHFGGGAWCESPLMSGTPDWEGMLTCSEGHRFDGKLVKGLLESGRLPR
jgi:hypothetical protein